MKGAIDSLSAEDIVNRCFEGLAGFLRRDHPGSGQSRAQSSSAASRSTSRASWCAASTSRRPTGCRDFGNGQLHPARPGDALHREHRRHRHSGLHSAQLGRTLGVERRPVQHAEVDLPRQRGLRHADDYTLTAVGRGVSDGRYDANGIECADRLLPASRPTSSRPMRTTASAGRLLRRPQRDDQVRRASAASNGEFFINVTNLFDADPILLPETGLAANSTYSDLLGRTFRVGVRHSSCS